MVQSRTVQIGFPHDRLDRFVEPTRKMAVGRGPRPMSLSRGGKRDEALVETPVPEDRWGGILWDDGSHPRLPRIRSWRQVCRRHLYRQARSVHRPGLLDPRIRDRSGIQHLPDLPHVGTAGAQPLHQPNTEPRRPLPPSAAVPVVRRHVRHKRAQLRPLGRHRGRGLRLPDRRLDKRTRRGAHPERTCLRLLPPRARAR
jgi:hypothetical protein